MNEQRPPQKPLHRREALRTLGLGLALVPFGELLACGSDGAAADAAGGAGGAGGGGAGGAGAGGGAGGGGAAGAGGSGAGTAWATGGTAAMKDEASYPNPFTSAGGTTCAISCGTTIGPCHTTSPKRVDVSDGLDGLPVRLVLRVVDESCAPVAGAIVEIWHTNASGVYSGTVAALCNSAAADKAAQYFRGYQETDANGAVAFDTCFPGWYPGRAVHIHFRVMQSAYDPADGATASVISQLFFTDELVKAISGAEPAYSARGLPDTLLGTDNIIGGESDPSAYVCDVARMSDGAMLASKTITLRKTAAACSLKSASGGNPPGG